jgi:signal transduction histidine kinase
VSFGLAIGYLLALFRFDYMESVLYDARMRLRPAPATSKQIHLIEIDPRTVETLGRAPSAEDHARLVRQLAQAGAKAIVYFINPNELVGAYDELKDFADAARAAPHFLVGVEEMPLKGQRDAIRLLPPFESLKALSAPTTADRLSFARDEVSRRMVLSYQGKALLHLSLARELNPELKNEANVRGAFDYLGTSQAYIDFRPAGAYPRTSFRDALDGRFRGGNGSARPLEGLTVMVGRDLDSTPKDYVRTPYSRSVVAMTILEAHANMLDTLILNSAPLQAPAALNVFFTCLISILTVFVTLGARPSMALAWLGTVIAAFSSACLFAFCVSGYWIAMAHPILAIFICYYFFIPYRLIMENRRSWEYFQKNRLLTQVEELKTNFLSMMSHDLKTPLARIQGMADVVAKDPNPLSPRQREALERLSRSADELNQFIASILSLGRIESKELKLSLSSRDLNSLLVEVCENADYLAKSRGIEIVREFEPIFSLKIDADLIRQVFANLVENAIKYSPDNAKILVSTEERDGKAVVQVADQGPGIAADDLPNIFMKFYRSKDAKASSIKGSGLGLHLAKYFAELHNGSIAVDTAPGQGSTFTVELPLDAAPP